MRKPFIVGIILALVILLTAMPAHTTGLLSDQVICLDPGHGGSDPGAVNEAYNLEEKEINLDVAYAVKALLEADGADEVVMTRTGDDSKSNSDRYTFANEQGADILVSIHTNSVLKNPDTVDGSMGLYFHEDDKFLAQAIYDVMYSYLQSKAPDDVLTFTDWGLRKFASGVLLKSDMPAAMMEPLCMSHPAEAERLVAKITACGNPEDALCRRAQIAQAIHDGILNYFAQGGGGDDGHGPPCDSPPCGKKK